MGVNREGGREGTDGDRGGLEGERMMGRERQRKENMAMSFNHQRFNALIYKGGQQQYLPQMVTVRSKLYAYTVWVLFVMYYAHKKLVFMNNPFSY